MSRTAPNTWNTRFILDGYLIKYLRFALANNLAAGYNTLVTNTNAGIDIQANALVPTYIHTLRFYLIQTFAVTKCATAGVY